MEIFHSCQLQQDDSFSECIYVSFDLVQKTVCRNMLTCSVGFSDHLILYIECSSSGQV